jgi:hypothetical protein
MRVGAGLQALLCALSWVTSKVISRGGDLAGRQRVWVREDALCALVVQDHSSTTILVIGGLGVSMVIRQADQRRCDMIKY